MNNLTKFIFLAAGVLIQFTLNAQFEVMGNAKFTSMSRGNYAIENVSLCPKFLDDFSGMGVCNIWNLDDGDNYFSIVEGSVNTGINWNRKYDSESNLKAIKSIYFEGFYYVLYKAESNVGLKSNGGILKLSQLNGKIEAQVNFGFGNYDPGDPDFANFSPKDIIIYKNSLIVAGYNTDYTNIIYPEYGKLISFNLSDLSIKGGTELTGIDNDSYIVPEQLTIDNDFIYVTSYLRRHYSGKRNVHIACIEYKEEQKEQFKLQADKEIFLDERASICRIAYNPYNKNIVLVFQQYYAIDGAGILTFANFEPGTLIEINHQVYQYPLTNYNSELEIDEKYIYLAGGLSELDARRQGGRTLQFDHNGTIIQALESKIGREVLGGEAEIFAWNNNFLYTNRIANVYDEVKWILGFGASKDCDIKDEPVYKIDMSFKMNPNLNLASILPVNLEVGITSPKDDLIVRIECGDVKGRQNTSSDPIINYTVDGDNITVNSNVEISKYKVYDLRGQLIASSASNDNNIKIASTTWPRGLYILHLESSQNNKFQRKIYIP